MTEHTAQPGIERTAITWQPMDVRKEPRWHALLSSAVAGTVRGLALVVASSPAHRRTA